MRGKGNNMSTGCLNLGITPAYAGKSVELNVLFCLFQDHPRLCGEKTAMHGFPAMTGGSPPPMRGKAVRCGEFASYSGITPAYAGKSSSRSK